MNFKSVYSLIAWLGLYAVISLLLIASILSSIAKTPVTSKSIVSSVTSSDNPYAVLVPPPQPPKPEWQPIPVTTHITSSQKSGNAYSPGNCTWYVKNRRPDIPNNLGNASSWLNRARSQGLPTGTLPRVGAVGKRSNHVVYVERVNSDNTVTISEMNHLGFNKISHRTLPFNYFEYIY
jgi:surface antigen